MARYRLDLGDFMDDMFSALERCSDGVHGHEVIIEAKDEIEAGQILGVKLALFFPDHFNLEGEDDEKE